MNEKQLDNDASDRQRLYDEYVSVFNEIWPTLSEIEKTEYQRMRREAYALLATYYKAMDNVSRLHKEGKELSASVQKLVTRWTPIGLVIVICTLFFDLEFLEPLVSTAMILLIGIIGIKLYVQYRTAQDESEWEWRRLQIAAQLEGHGLGHVLLNSAWSLKKREETDLNFDSESIEVLECHHKIRNALLDSIRPGATLGVHLERFAKSASEKGVGESGVGG